MATFTFGGPYEYTVTLDACEGYDPATRRCESSSEVKTRLPLGNYTVTVDYTTASEPPSADKMSRELSLDASTDWAKVKLDYPDPREGAQWKGELTIESMSYPPQAMTPSPATSSGPRP